MTICVLFSITLPPTKSRLGFDWQQWADGRLSPMSFRVPSVGVAGHGPRFLDYGSRICSGGLGPSPPAPGLYVLTAGGLGVAQFGVRFGPLGVRGFALGFLKQNAKKPKVQGKF